MRSNLVFRTANKQFSMKFNDFYSIFTVNFDQNQTLEVSEETFTEAIQECRPFRRSKYSYQKISN